MRWRIPGVSDGQTFTELFSHYPFTLLDEGDMWSVSGLCGQIWTPARDYARLSGPGGVPRLGPSAGRCGCCSRTGRSRASDGRSTLVSEARVEPVDPSARVRLRALWTVIGPFERLVGAEPLTVAVQRAEAARVNGNCAG